MLNAWTDTVPLLAQSTKRGMTIALPSSPAMPSRRVRLTLPTFLLAALGCWTVVFWPRAHHFPAAAHMGTVDKANYLLGITTCPDPNHPILPVDHLIDPQHTSLACTDVPSSSPDFDVQVCAVASTCNSFSVRINRRDKDRCTQMERQNVPTLSAERADMLRNERGPDSFLLRTDGAQRWTTETSRYEGECSYRFDVSLSNGGAVWLELWHRFSDYNAINETNTGWAPDHFAPLFPEPVRLDTCPDRCPMRYAPRIKASEQWAFDKPLHAYEQERLPLCPLDEPVQGVWLPRHPMDTVDPPVEIVHQRHGNTPLMGRYEFSPRCRWAHSGMQFADHTPCTNRGGKKFKVLCFGDSHGRYTLLNFVYWLEGRDGYYPDDDRGKYAAGNQRHFDFGDLYIEFIAAPYAHYLRGLDNDYLAQFDAVFVSMGSWSAMDGRPADYYKDEVTSVMQRFHDVLAALPPDQAHRQTHVYMPPAPFPPHLVGPSRDRGDHRTNPQLQLFGQVGKQVAREFNWRVVDLYERGMPVMLEMLAADGMHLSPGAAQVSITHEVLAKAEICPNIEHVDQDNWDF